MTPRLSVIAPIYNGERFLAQTLASVREQHIDGIELIFIDDGSTDGSLEVLRTFAETVPARILRPGRLGNWVAATNLGLREATGEWACFLHQDDLWLPGRIARLWPELRTTESALILHNAMFVGPAGKRLGPWNCPLEPGLIPPDEFLERLLIQNFIAMPSPVVRRSAVLDSGGMDEALWFSADWDLWLRLGAMAPVRFIGETLSAFRVHPASMTAARKLKPNEWDHQLTTVLDRQLRCWSAQGKRRAAVERAARASIAVNSTLAAASRGEPMRPWSAVSQLLALGPSGWRRYLRDSTILQRVGARIRA